MVETHLDVNRDRVQINGLKCPSFSDGNEKEIGRNQTGEKRKEKTLFSSKHISINRQGERSKSRVIGLHLYLCCQ